MNQKNSLYFMRLMENFTESVFFKDRESRFTKINKACAFKFGLKDPAEANGKTDGDFFGDEHASKALADEKSIIETGQPILHKIEKEDFTDKRKSAWSSTSKFPLYDDSGEIIGTFGISKNVTTEYKYKSRLEKSYEDFRKFSEQVPGLFYLYQQFPDGRAMMPFASSAINDIYELSPDDVKESINPVLERVHKDDVKNVVFSIRRSVKDLELWNCEFRMELPEKGLRWIRGRAKPEKQNDGSVIGYGYVTDITEIKKREKELRETVNIIGEQNKRLMNFAHIVSHNLRNHAGNISMLLSLYAEEESEDEKSELFDYILTASQRLNETISDLNDIIDQQNNQEAILKKVKLRNYLSKIKEILTTEILAENVSFIEEIDRTLEFEYNPSYLESILLNLLSNAIKYRYPDRTPEIKIKAYSKNDQVCLEISDNGLGIDLDKYGDKLFGMYNTFHKNENSKGIGLFITKNQIESMGGSIKVESVPDVGTTFKIRLK